MGEEWGRRWRGSQIKSNQEVLFLLLINSSFCSYDYCVGRFFEETGKLEYLKKRNKKQSHEIDRNSAPSWELLDYALLLDKQYILNLLIGRSILSFNCYKVMERFLNDCRRNNSKVITPTSHNRSTETTRRTNDHSLQFPHFSPPSQDLNISFSKVPLE